MAFPTFIQIAQAVLAAEMKWAGNGLPQITGIQQVASRGDARFYAVTGVMIRQVATFAFYYAVEVREDGDIREVGESSLDSARLLAFRMSDQYAKEMAE